MKSGLRLILIAFAAVLFTSTVAQAASDGLLPFIAKGQGDKCVEDTDFMRRNHMNLLKHQRDDTMHRGIRTQKHALKECIACHAVNGEDGKPVSVADPQHFCRSCHEYAAVKPDCFQCHASTPSDEQAAR